MTNTKSVRSHCTTYKQKFLDTLGCIVILIWVALQNCIHTHSYIPPLVSVGPGSKTHHGYQNPYMLKFHSHPTVVPNPQIQPKWIMWYCVYLLKKIHIEVDTCHSDQGLAVYIHIHVCTIFFLPFHWALICEKSVSSVQLLSHVRLCDPMDWKMTGSPVHHQFPQLTQTHVHRVGDAI